MKDLSQWLGRGLIGLALLLPFASQAVEGITVLDSNFGVDETEQRLIEAVENNGLTVMVQVDHKANAKTVGLDMPATRLVVFGNPKLGTQLMKCSPTVAIDLPMKMLIWEEGETVKVAYNTVDYLVDRHQIDDCAASALEKVRQALDGFAKEAAGVE